jgi:endoglucanase
VLPSYLLHYGGEEMKKHFFKLLLCLGLLLAASVNMPVSAVHEPSASDIKIHVDQVGYLPNYQKVAIVAATPGSNEF